mgnify:CR=1 FL=1
MTNHEERLRVAIIGFGKMGVLHGALVNATGLGEVVAIVDRERKILKSLNRLFHGRVKAVEDLNELRDLGIDAVFITTPIPTHYPLAVRSLDLGIKGLFVEKTLTDSAQRSSEIHERVSTMGIANAIGFQKRFMPTFRRFREIVSKLEPGNIREVRAYAYSEDFLGINRSVGILEPRGGVLRDLGSHAIDLLTWLFGSEVKVLDMGISIGSDAPCGEVVVKMVVNGIDSVVNTSWCKEGYRVPEIGMRVITDSGELFVNDYELLINDFGMSKKIYSAQLEENVKYLLGAPEYYTEVEDFLRAVINGGGFTGAGFRDGLIVDSIIDEIIKTYHAHTGRR